MSFTLYIHVGSGKAGSSAIQDALSKHSEGLEKQKSKYLGLMLERLGDEDFAWKKSYGWPVFQSNIELYKPELIDVLGSSIKELMDDGWNSAIWSNESFFGQVELIEDVMRLGKDVGFETKVVCYFRNHVSWSVSAYKQWGIKHKTYEGPIQSFQDWKNGRGINFSRVATRWKRAFGENFLIKNYDADKNLVENFLTLCNIDVDKINLVSRVANKTPEGVPLSLWALYNNQFKGEVLPNSLQPLLKRSGILDHPIKGVSYNEILPKEQDLIDLKEAVSGDLVKLNEILVDAGEPPLQFPESNMIPDEVSRDDILAALLMMLVKHDNEIRSLRRKLKELGA